MHISSLSINTLGLGGSVSGGDIASMYLPLTTSIVPTKGVGSATFTRTTSASVTDFEGLIKTAKSGEARFTGARRVENIVADTTIFSTNWVYEGSVTKSVTSGVLTLNMPANTSDRCFCSIPGGLARKTVLFHLDIYSNSPTTIDLSIQGNITTVNHAVLNITTGYRRYSLPAFTFNAGDAGAYFLITNTEALAKTLFIKNPQIEDVTGQANQKPSEYVSNGVLSAPYHGAGADGVKYFTTYNGNTVSGNVVTEATGANIPDSLLKGYLTEPASTNVVQYSENFTNWVNQASAMVLTSGIADPKGGTGAYTLGTTDPVNALYRASDIAVIGTTYTTSIYMRRRSGTGPIYIRDVNNSTGVTQLEVSNQLTSSWKRIVLPGIVASSTTAWSVLLVGTVGDTVDIFGAMIEANPAPTSYIATAGATATRNADNLTYPTAGNVLNTAGTWYSEVTPQNTIPAGTTPAYGYNFIRDFGINKNTLTLYNGNVMGYDDVTIFTGPAWSPVTGGQRYKVADKWTTEKQHFLNGVAGLTNPLNPQTYGANMSIGNYGASVGLFSWNGNIRNIKIYPKALTASKIIELQKTYITDENGNYITDENGTRIFTY